MTVTPLSSDRDGDATVATPRVALRWARLERLLTDLGYSTDAQRAELLGVNRRTIIRWRGGQTSVRLGTVLRMAQVLGVGLEELVEVTSDAA